MKIARCRFRVSSLEGLAAFYCDCFGMRRFASDGGLVVGYDSSQCLLEFKEDDCRPYQASPNDLYWKIGITVRDLDHAVAQLRALGLSITDPRQFLDVGYLCHLQDPNGFAIELLQQGFEGNHAAVETHGIHPIATQAILAHVTLRVTDLAAIQALCERQLKMRLMSEQRISLPDRKFNLYFYGWSEEALPVSDVSAVENREWLYARPYSLLEVQHLVFPQATIVKPNSLNAGFTALGYEDGNGQIRYLSIEDLTAGQ